MFGGQSKSASLAWEAPEDLSALALTNMGWRRYCCCQARAPCGWEWLSDKSSDQLCFQRLSLSQRSTWPVNGRLEDVNCVGSPQSCRLGVAMGRGTAPLHLADSIPEYHHGPGDDPSLPASVLRSSAALSPMQSSFSPTRTAWSFWCAMKMRGCM